MKKSLTLQVLPYLLSCSPTASLSYTLAGINSLVAAGVMNNASVEDTPKLTPVKATGKIQQLRNDVMNANPTDGAYQLTDSLTHSLTHLLTYLLTCLLTHSNAKKQLS